MIAIEKKTLQDGLCCRCNCSGFEAKLNYELNFQDKIATIMDVSEFGSGDDLKVVILHFYDNQGKEKHSHIDISREALLVDLTGLVLSDLSITATVISIKGCMADLGIYNFGNTALTGTIAKNANQENRRLI